MKQVQNYMAEIALGDSSFDLVLVVIRVMVTVAIVIEVVVAVVLLQLQSGAKTRSLSAQ